MKRLKCKKWCGVYYYNKIEADDINGLDAPIYELYEVYNGEKYFVDNFGSYGDMKYFVEHGEYL